MKKILVLSGILFFTMGASFAWIGENETNDINTLRAQGFSETTLKIMDLVNSANQGKNSDYERQFTKPESDSKIGRAYTKLKYYVDPIQDDQMFGEHQVNFTNNWIGNEEMYEPKHTMEIEEENYEVEDL